MSNNDREYMDAYQLREKIINIAMELQLMASSDQVKESINEVKRKCSELLGYQATSFRKWAQLIEGMNSYEKEKEYPKFAEQCVKHIEMLTNLFK